MSAHVKTIELVITHSFFNISDAQLENSFNDWEESHIAQGFAWRPGVVSFGTVGAAVKVRLDVAVDSVEPNWVTLEQSEVAIRVPFFNAGDKIAIQTVVGRDELGLRPGNYCLQYEMRASDVNSIGKARVTFWPSSQCDFKIGRLPGGIPHPLLLSAEPMD